MNHHHHHHHLRTAKLKGPYGSSSPAPVREAKRETEFLTFGSAARDLNYSTIQKLLVLDDTGKITVLDYKIPVATDHTACRCLGVFNPEK